MKVRKMDRLHGVVFVGIALDRETTWEGEGERCMIFEAGWSIVVGWCWLVVWLVVWLIVWLVVLDWAGLIEREGGMLGRSCAIPERHK